VLSSQTKPRLPLAFGGNTEICDEFCHERPTRQMGAAIKQNAQLRQQLLHLLLVAAIDRVDRTSASNDAAANLAQPTSNSRLCILATRLAIVGLG